jgi:hypothetical protein
MSTAKSNGLLAISIDLELDAQHCGTRDQQALDRVASRLLDMLTRHRLTATWSVADPAVSAATEKLAAAGGHEIAVLGDPAWVGSTAGRARFGRELERRVGHARECGLQVTTLALRKVHLDAHLDLVVKNGLSAIRGPESAVRLRNEFNQPQSLYSRLWLMWPSIVLPGDLRWWPGGGRIGAARRGLAGAVRRGEVFHLMIDGLKLAAHGWVGLWGLERVMRSAAEFRDAGLLDTMTVAGAAARLGELRRTKTSAPLLRPAA